MIKEIDQFEKETTQSYEANKDNKKNEEANKIFKELESFHLEWTKYLKQVTINDNSVSAANNAANTLNWKAKKQHFNSDELIFNGSILK